MVFNAEHVMGFVVHSLTYLEACPFRHVQGVFDLALPDDFAILHDIICRKELCSILTDKAMGITCR